MADMISVTYFGVLLVNMLSLIANSIYDWRMRRVSLILVGVTAAAGLAWRVGTGNLFAWDVLWGLLPGVVILLLAMLTRESIGYGDGWVLLASGIGLGGTYMLTMCVIAFVAAGLWSLVLIVCFHKGRKYEMPFLPFLLLGYGVTLVYFCGTVLQ